MSAEIEGRRTTGDTTINPDSTFLALFNSDLNQESLERLERRRQEHLTNIDKFVRMQQEGNHVDEFILAEQRLRLRLVEEGIARKKSSK